MIEALTEFTREMWSEWHGSAPAEISIALGSGGPAHRTRATCFVFEGRHHRPSLVMKIAFAEQEAGFLSQEYDALTAVRPLLSKEVRNAIPEALGLSVVEGNTVMTMRALSGKRLLVPDLTGRGSPMARSSMTRFYRDSFDWSKTLGKQTGQGGPSDASDLARVVERFLPVASPSDVVTRRIRSFGDAVAASDIVWEPSWQHCDLAVGNVLVDGRTMHFLDWEHAESDAPPWFDTAQSLGASARLAKRQSGEPTSRDAALRALGPSMWAGKTLRAELTSAWDFALPLGWGIALTSMATAIRQHVDQRMGAEDWIDFTVALFGDDELRDQLAWAVPDLVSAE